jgi:predicted ferric reductase
MTFFVRKGIGFTNVLQAQNNPLTLVEGPYPNISSEQVLRCDRLLLISGGIGITALVPFVANHWNIKLCWSVKQSAGCLFDVLEEVVARVNDKDIRIGRRLDIAALVIDEAEAGWKKLGVVESGPPQLFDDARALVTAIAKQYTQTEFRSRCRGILLVADMLIAKLSMVVE